MNKNCPKCGHSYDAEVSPELQGACPRCVAELLRSRPGDASAPLHEDDAPPLGVGARLGKFEVLDYLGRGGMGFVYKAKQAGLDRLVALKILAPRLAGSPEFAARFGREAKALAALSHPNIVQIFDYGQEGGLYFLVMEYVDGTSLRRILSTQRITPETALRYVPQICDALEYAHTAGVVHRDIKPENILIDKRGGLKIADFGLAKMAAAAGAPGSPVQDRPTVSGQVMGTPHYMAPEQVENMAAVDHRADIYSLGVVFYEMLTGELPLGRFPAPSQRVQVDVRFDEVVLRALEKEPERRYQTVTDMKGDVATLETAGSKSQNKPRVAVQSGSQSWSTLKWGLGLGVGVLFGNLLFHAFVNNDPLKGLVVGAIAAGLVLTIYAVIGAIRQHSRKHAEIAGGSGVVLGTLARSIGEMPGNRTSPVRESVPAWMKVLSFVLLLADVIGALMLCQMVVRTGDRFSNMYSELGLGRLPVLTEAIFSVPTAVYVVVLCSLLLILVAKEFSAIRRSVAIWINIAALALGVSFFWLYNLSVYLPLAAMSERMIDNRGASSGRNAPPPEHKDSNTISWGQPVGGLRAGLAVKQAMFEVGKPMEFQAHVENLDEIETLFVPDPQTNWRFVFETGAHKIQHPPTQENSWSLHRIAGGEHRTLHVILGDGPEIHKTCYRPLPDLPVGKYTVTASSLRAPEFDWRLGRLETGPVEIEIVEPGKAGNPTPTPPPAP